MNFLVLIILSLVYNTCGSSTVNTSTPLTIETSSNASDAMSSGHGYNTKTTLYENLLKNYNIRVKPRKNQSHIVNVSARFSLQGVLEFDTVSQRLMLLGFFKLSWKDEILVWNTSLHGEIVEIKLLLSQIWEPNARLSLAFEDEGKIGDPNDIVVIQSDGQTMLATDNTYHILCDVDIRYYPFDKQKCKFHIFVQEFGIPETNLESFTAAIDSNYFKQSTEWKVLSLQSFERVYWTTRYGEINLVLQRRHEFILFTIICPLILLSVLNVGVFLVPVESGEKGSIAVTIFLSYGVFITTISEELPHNSLNISYMLIYILLLLLLSVLAVVYSYIHSYLYVRYGNERVNVRCLRKLFQLRGTANKHVPSVKPSETVIDQMDTIRHHSLTLNNNDCSLETDQLTWHTLLLRLDTLVFIFLLFLVVTATPIVFKFLSSGSN